MSTPEERAGIGTGVGAVPERRADVVVVGGGVAGLAAAHRLAVRTPHLDVALLESSQRLGGKVRTEHVDGFVVEAGPDSLMTAKPVARELVDLLGLAGRLQAPRPAGRTHVLRGGRLVPLPEGLDGFVPRRLGPLARSRIFSPVGKARMGLEPLVPVRRGGADESLADFVTRRLGREAYDWMAEPLAGGIFGADPARLSLLATMPHLREAETTHRSLVRAALARGRATRGGAAGGAERSGAGAPPPAVAAPGDGMEELVERLVARLTARIVLGCRLTALRADGAGYRLVVDEGGTTTTWQARAVVLAVPSQAAAQALAGLAPEAAATLRGFGCTSTATVSLGYRTRDLGAVPALSGYLVPRREGRATRAVTVTSAKFDGRAPDGHVLFRLSLGGAGRPSLDHLGDEELVSVARDELARSLGVGAGVAPVLVRTHRFADTMPEYAVGHLDRVRQLEHGLRGHPGVQPAGSAFHGLGVPDCLASGQRAADLVLGALVSAGVQPPPA